MREVFVTKFKIKMNPVNTAFTGRLVHLGRHVFQKVSGASVEFSSQPFFIPIQSGEMSEFKDLRGIGDEKIHGLSAFGEWAILAADTVDQNMLQNLQSITLTFFGNSRASTD
jgi:hypothetical protein